MTSRLTLGDAQRLQHTIDEELPAQLFATRLDFVDAFAVVGHLGPGREHFLEVGILEHLGGY